LHGDGYVVAVPCERRHGARLDKHCFQRSADAFPVRTSCSTLPRRKQYSCSLGFDSCKCLNLYCLASWCRGAFTKNHNPPEDEEWFKDKYNPIVGKISIVALLLTLIVLFSFEGQTILNNPLSVGQLAVPNLIHYSIMITWTYLLGYFLGWKYESAIDTTIIGSSSHFEVAIAVAVTLCGIGSGAALATVIGPLLEVPLMLSLVKLGLRTRKYFPRKESQVVQ
jgi:hypothetical protein